MRNIVRMKTFFNIFGNTIPVNTTNNEKSEDTEAQAMANAVMTSGLTIGAICNI